MRQIAGTDVFPIGLGAMPMSLRGRPPEEQSIRTIHAALDAGTPSADVGVAVDRLRDTCTKHGGSAVVVDAPAAVKSAVDVWGPIPALDLMRRVKDQFDPDHRLAPGRFVGGI